MCAAKVLFITGTDTDVGKTVVACGLLSALNQLGFTTAALKPVAAGAERIGGTLINSDAQHLQHCASVSLPYEVVNPCVFPDAVAPHIAAKNRGQVLTVAKLKEASQGALRANANYLVVEGAGGWLVPLNEQETLADFAAAITAEVILVVGLKLGCINHALLSEQAVRASGLKVVGWVANHISPAMPESAANIEALRVHLAVPLLGEVPHIPKADSTAIAASLDLSSLIGA